VSCKLIEYTSLGHTDRIGASCHYLRLDDWGLILDTGLDPDWKAPQPLPDFDTIADKPVNAIIISHAHLDHLAALPVAVRYFPHARIYMTSATVALSEIMLFHYLRVQERRAQQEMKELTPFYTYDELENILFLFQSFEYKFPFNIHSFQESGIKITFWDAGHILGSAGIEIQWKGQKIFYTGNTKKSPQFILRGAKYPSKTDVLITESTYGENQEAPRLNKNHEIKRLVNFMNEKLGFGGGVLIPVFALGRTQEIMILLHNLIKGGRIQPVPIYLIGFGNKINKVYDRLLHKIYPSYDTKLLETITFDRLNRKRFHKPSIILATSGMMFPNTLSYEIAGDFLSDVRNGIAIVGWADPETPGGTLRDKKIGRIGEVFNVEQIDCGIEIFLFSAHSHRVELLDMVKSLRPRKTIVCHGEPGALRWMRDNILKKSLSGEVVIPKKGQPLPIL
jgi:Cft2 family RNA processing exonuclease